MVRLKFALFAGSAAILAAQGRLEAGAPSKKQLAFVGAVLLVAVALRKVPLAWPRWAQAVPAYGIGTMATFWFLQRAASLV